MATAEGLAAVAAAVDAFDARPYVAYCSDWTVPVVATAMYLVVVHSAAAMGFRGLSKATVRPYFIAWNLLMSAVSGWVFVTSMRWFSDEYARIAPGVRSFDDVVHHFVCSEEMMSRTLDGMPGLASVVVVYMKVVELGDTLFLVLLGKPVIFLHWYHHTTVLLFSWYSFAILTPLGCLFSLVNYGIHTVMYFYYAVSQLTRALRGIRPWLTAVQTLQMFVGIYVGVMSYVYSNGAVGCAACYTSTYFTVELVMYASYAALFLHFAYRNYVAKGRGGGEGKDKGKVE